MSVSLTIAGVEKSTIVNWESLERQEVLTKETNSLSFKIKKISAGAYKPVAGDEVILTIGGTKEFGGYVTEIKERIDARVEEIQIVCKDYTHELDRQLVSKSYLSETVDDIIADLVSTFATGFTVTNVNCPILIDQVKFNYLPISKCLEKLTELVGNYEWYTDYNKDIHFFESSSELSPFNLSDTGGNYVFNSLNIKQNTNQLRNQVVIRGGFLISSTNKTELMSGDGTTTIYPLATKFSEKPTVLIGASPQTVGIANIDTSGFDCYWDYNQKSLEFISASVSGTANISAEAPYEYPLILQKRNESSITTYGLFETVIVDKNIRDLETASLRADAELIRYSIPAKTARFITYDNGLKTGQTITIQSTIRDENDEFKIQYIVSRLKTPNTDELIHEIECMTADDLGINDILSRLLIMNPSDQIDVSQDEVIARIRQFSEALNITWNEEINLTSVIDANYTWTSGTTPLVWNLGVWET